MAVTTAGNSNMDKSRGLKLCTKQRLNISVPTKLMSLKFVFFGTRIAEKRCCTIQLKLYKEIFDYCLSFVFLWTQLKMPPLLSKTNTLQMVCFIGPV